MGAAVPYALRRSTGPHSEGTRGPRPLGGQAVPVPRSGIRARTALVARHRGVYVCDHERRAAMELERSRWRTPGPSQSELKLDGGGSCAFLEALGPITPPPRLTKTLRVQEQARSVR